MVRPSRVVQLCHHFFLYLEPPQHKVLTEILRAYLCHTSIGTHSVRPVLLTLTDAFLFQTARSDDECSLCHADHVPKVAHSIGQRPLRCDKSRFAFVKINPTGVYIQVNLTYKQDSTVLIRQYVRISIFFAVLFGVTVVCLVLGRGSDLL